MVPTNILLNIDKALSLRIFFSDNLISLRSKPNTPFFDNFCHLPTNYTTVDTTCQSKFRQISNIKHIYCNTYYKLPVSHEHLNTGYSYPLRISEGCINLRYYQERLRCYRQTPAFRRSTYDIHHLRQKNFHGPQECI